MKQIQNADNSQGAAPKPQIGALCYRVRNGKVQFLLVTTRRSGRWVPPKGNPMNGKNARETAEIEAFEEAGAVGKIKKKCAGEFHHASKSRKSSDPALIALYPLKVKQMIGDFPERKQRRRKWFSRKKAIAIVRNPELAQVLARFEPGKAKAKARAKKAKHKND